MSCYKYIPDRDMLSIEHAFECFFLHVKVYKSFSFADPQNNLGEAHAGRSI